MGPKQKEKKGDAAARGFTAEEDLATLLPRLEGHAELDRTAVAYHAEQCDAWQAGCRCQTE